MTTDGSAGMILRYADPVYDRTADDIRLKAKKAYFNVADFQRIYINAKIVARLIALLFEYQYDYLYDEETNENGVFYPQAFPVPGLSYMTDVNNSPKWPDPGSITVPASLMRVPAAALVTVRSPSYLSGLNYADVNSWEQAIDVNMKTAKATVDYYVQSGVAGCGQSRFYQNEWRPRQYVAEAVSPHRQVRCGISTSGSGLTRGNNYRRYA